MVDPIADMLTRIRNAIMARHESVDIPYSNMKFGISKILKDEGYIRNYKTFVDETRKKFLKVYISYDENDEAMKELKLGKAIMESLIKKSPDNAEWASRLEWINGQIEDLSKE